MNYIIELLIIFNNMNMPPNRLYFSVIRRFYKSRHANDTKSVEKVIVCISEFNASFNNYNTLTSIQSKPIQIDERMPFGPTQNWCRNYCSF